MGYEDLPPIPERKLTWKQRIIRRAIADGHGGRRWVMDLRMSEAAE